MVEIKRSNVDSIASIKRFLSNNKKTLIIAACCFYAVIFISNMGSTEKSIPSLRSTAGQHVSQGSRSNEIKAIKPVDITLTEGHKVQQTSSDGDKEQVDEKKVGKDFRNVMVDVTNHMKDGFTVTLGRLHDAIVEAKTSIHMSVDDILRSTQNLSDKDVENFDEEVSKKVEEELVSLYMELKDEAVLKVKEELDSIQKDEIGDKNKSAQDIELDVKSIRSFMSDRSEAEVDDLEKTLEGKIRSVTTKVEKTLLKENFGVEISEEELEDAEVESAAAEISDEFFEVGNDEQFSMQAELQDVTENLEKNVKTALDQFLIKEKKFSASDAKEIEEKVFTELDDSVKSLIGDEIDKLEKIANDKMDDVEDTAADDLSVIQRAKELGMHSTSSDKDSTNAVDIVETRLNALKESMEKSFIEVVAASKDQLILAFSEVTKDVEKQVFEENGIDVSEKELATLVEKETKNIDDSAST